MARMGGEYPSLKQTTCFDRYRRIPDVAMTCH
jgi:hypothetical protein